MSNCSITAGCAGSVSTPNRSPLSSNANARRCTRRHVTKVCLFIWAGTLLASSHPGAGGSYLPGWCLTGRNRGEGRSHIKRMPPCCTSALGLPDRMAEHPTRNYRSSSFFGPFIIPDMQYQAHLATASHLPSEELKEPGQYL